MNRYQIKITTFVELLFITAALLHSSSASPGKEFAPLECNADDVLDSDYCLNNARDFSTLFSDVESAALTIPCGECVKMDIIDGSTITVPGGLNVLGKLYFPSSANVKLRTTAIFVQGVWSMAIPEEGNSVTVALYGSGEQTLCPHDASSCVSNDFDSVYGYECTCSEPEGIGKLPFVVAGGKYI